MIAFCSIVNIRNLRDGLIVDADKTSHIEKLYPTDGGLLFIHINIFISRLSSFFVFITHCSGGWLDMCDTYTLTVLSECCFYISSAMSLLSENVFLYVTVSVTPSVIQCYIYCGEFWLIVHSFCDKGIIALFVASYWI